MAEKKSIKDFEKKFYEGKITANGRLIYSPTKGNLVADVNLSSIETKLIQEAGRWCLRFASDLLVDWFLIRKAMENGTLRSKSMLFGFREDGVDGSSYVLHHYENERDAMVAQYYYRTIWRLDIEVETDEDGEVFIGGDVKFCLYECSR